MTTEIRAPRGDQISCRGWQQEAALRMLMNSVDVASQREDSLSRAENLGTGWDPDHFEALITALRNLTHDETLLVQDGAPSGVIRTHPLAPRLLIVNVNRTRLAYFANRPRPETGGKSEENLNRLGLIAHGETAVGSWMNTGGQELLAGAYATFAAVGQRRFSDDLAGKLVVSGGFGRMGWVQPLAAVLNGAAFLGVEVEAERIKACIRAGGCDYCVNDLDEALRILKIAVRQKQAISVGLAGNCATIIPELVRRGVVPDLLTDQTSAHDPLNGYVPAGMGAEDAARLRLRAPEEYLRRSYESIGRHAAGMIALQKLGSVVFEYSNNLRAAAFEHGGVPDAYEFPDFVSAYVQPLISQEQAPFRCVALSGNQADIRRVDHAALELSPSNNVLRRWIHGAHKHIKFHGLPARVGWLTSGEQAQLGGRVNEMVAKGELKAPVVLGRDDWGCGAAAMPGRKTENVDHGTDEISARLDVAVSAASGAAWVSMSGVGDSGVSGVAVVADGTPHAAASIERLFAPRFAEAQGA